MKDKMMTSLMIGIVGALFLFVSVSNAYDYAGCKWPSNNMVYDAHSLSSGWQDVVSGGRVPWNNVTSSGIGIYRDDSSSNDVTLGYVQNGWLAVTSCSGSTIVRAPITFSTGYNWYTGTGTPTTNYYDARGVATHEFGHAIGFHHTQSTNCPSNIWSRATMCEGYGATHTYKRTLVSRQG